MRQRAPAGRIVESLGRIRESVTADLSVPDLAAAAGMSVLSYHAHFKQLTGTSPVQYIKAMRLHFVRPFCVGPRMAPRLRFAVSQFAEIHRLETLHARGGGRGAHWALHASLVESCWSALSR
ncbi:helix-turn-helix transcriptional regulator [Thioclava sp. BHET1]|nr:helix-turn-helix transcriptional regulator [Thioclava sp. BHET1]